MHRAYRFGRPPVHDRDAHGKLQIAAPHPAGETPGGSKGSCIMSMMSQIHAALTESGEIARVEELHETIAVIDGRIVDESSMGPAWVALLQRARASVVAELDAMMAGAL